ncbi:beta-mannosidase [Stereum hirsutum FP-91666 SS1]|uniref:beta-mannosidase n=1 Tax=Stereum hirsutum (strain FP-91666) TaxID=721885 RepID=UPI000440BF28|nr:beta-mannosidase [Stereum hirsutum FP-91666 SS1]EIM88069.1 beta-mannosidase [Stereum hirsutum FP-91666 SS1]
MTSSVRTLNDGWSFTQVGGGEGTKNGEWLAVSEFPTTVHVELLKLKRIPDPFVGLHEWDLQWIGEVEWAFKCSFSVSEQELALPNVDLVFDGLDTFATVVLNGKKILDTENQFVQYRAAVKEHLKVGANELLLTFDSAFLKGRALEEEHGKLELWNGDSSRLHVRKAQYNYGWDWGPILMTAGPWRPVHLHSYATRIKDIRISSNVNSDLAVDLDVSISLDTPFSGAADIVLLDESGKVVVKKDDVDLGNGDIKEHFHLEKEEVELWYPVGYGKQPLYSVRVQIKDAHGQVTAAQTQKIGFRRALVVQEPLADQEGLTFLFEINNIRIFCGGSNWIPADSFLTTMTPERYRAWLQLLVDGNQNMIRVWGGGIYEADAFYEICDELGILVWQDFAFGCGQYPAYNSFLENITVEAEQNVKRLRHHPSVVIFAGNNEDYQLAESSHLELDYSDEKSDFRKTNFPARHIYERVLPSIVEKHSDIHYHRSSPYSGSGKPTTDQRYGDLHQWNVWHGSQEPWHNWDILAGRFVSEFGMEAYPDIRTVDYWVGDDKSQRFPQSRVTVNHNKASGFERRLELYLVENFKHAFDMESYVYYTQIMQAETLAAAYRLWRRNWKGRGREYTAGALVWQINDCWPVTSWAIVDYFLRPKPAYFSIARELLPYTVGMTRKDHKTYADTPNHTAAFFTIRSVLEIWATNSTLAAKQVTLQVTSFDLDETAWRDGWEMEITLEPNACTEVWKGDVPGQGVRTKESEVPRPIIVSARLMDPQSGVVLSRYSNWPEPFKYLTFPPVSDLGLTITPQQDGESLCLSTERPIKGIVLDVEGEAVKWSDQAIDLVPGDDQIIRAVGLGGRKVKARFLGDGSA